MSFLSQTHDLSGELTGHLDEAVLTDGESVATLSGKLPYAVDGLHWKAATHRVMTAVNFEGDEARGIIDGDTCLRGLIKHVAVRSTKDIAVIVVEPPTEQARYGSMTGAR